MNLLKLLIPKEKIQVITEIESWTVKWTVATSITWGSRETFYKTFIKNEDAKEFMNQLNKSANFIKTPIITEIIHN